MVELYGAYVEITYITYNEDVKQYLVRKLKDDIRASVPGKILEDTWQVYVRDRYLYGEQGNIIDKIKQVVVNVKAEVAGDAGI